MQPHEARDEHVLDELLASGALLEDPMRLAAVLDELRARRAEPRPELRMAVADRLAAPPTGPRRADAWRARRRLAVGGVAALAVCLVGAVALLGPGDSSPSVVADGSAPSSLRLATAKLPAASRGGATAAKPLGIPGTSGTSSAPAIVPAPATGRLQDYRRG